MSRDNDLSCIQVRLDMTDQTVDTHVVDFTCPRPVKVTAVKLVPGLPLDTDGDTIAVDVSYSTDGFSSSDVEVAALAAVEYNDTTSTGFTTHVSKDIPLTAASQDDVGEVRVPADATIKTTITSTGASADGIVDVYVWYKVL